MRCWAIAFLAGILFFDSLQHLPSLCWGVTFGIIALLAFCLLPRYIWQWLRLPIAAILGCCWALCHAHLQLAHTLPQQLEGKVILAQGTILGVPEQKTRGWQMDFKIQRLAYQNSWHNTHLLAHLIWKQPPSNLGSGDQWQLQIQVKRPHSTFNPGEFDYEAWLFAHQINAIGYVRTSNENRLLHSSHWMAPVARIRQHIAQNIAKSLAGSTMTGFIQALAVGIRDQINQTQWQVLRNTGTNHLMAIAGLHIGLVTGAIWFLVDFFARRFGQLALYLPATELAALAALLTAMIYSALAGFALPTQRAVIMISVLLLATLLRRRLPQGQALFLALYCVMLMEPASVLSASFWLSFGAVALIIYSLAARLQQPHWLIGWGRLQWAIAFGLMPWTLLFFQQISFSGIIANAIAIPWVGFLVLPLTLLGSLCSYFCPFAAPYLFKLAALLMSWLWPVLAQLAAWDWLQWQGSFANNWLLSAALLGTWLLLAPRGLPGKWLGIFGVLPLLFWQPTPLQPGQLQLTLLDVGQGLDAVVRTQHHSLVFDVAPTSATFNRFSETILPFLRQNKISTPDKLILNTSTALDNQPPLYEVAFKPRQIFSNNAGTPGLEQALPCLAGQSWEWDGVNFSFIYPDSQTAYSSWQDSCILQITAKQRRILLLGALNRFSAKHLLEYPTIALQADVLVSVWHQSLDALLTQLVSIVQPKFLLYSTATVPRTASAATQIYSTYQCGAMSLQISSTAAVAAPICYRTQAGHYWNQ